MLRSKHFVPTAVALPSTNYKRSLTAKIFTSFCSTAKVLRLCSLCFRIKIFGPGCAKPRVERGQVGLEIISILYFPTYETHVQEHILTILSPYYSLGFASPVLPFPPLPLFFLVLPIPPLKEILIRLLCKRGQGEFSNFFRRCKILQAWKNCFRAPNCDSWRLPAFQSTYHR